METKRATEKGMSDPPAMMEILSTLFRDIGAAAMAEGTTRERSDSGDDE